MKLSVECRLDAAMARQHWVITRDQALRLGVTPTQIQHRLATGRWVLAHPGVYRMAAAPRDHRQRLLAACLAAGPLAAASHQSGAWLWGMIAKPPSVPVISVPRALKPRLAGVQVHRSRDFDPSRTLVREGIRCTDPLRVATDLAGVLPADQLAPVIDAALYSRIISARGLVDEISRRGARGRRGPTRLQRLLTQRGLTGGPEPSVLEAEAMRLFKRSGIPVLKREVRYGPDGQYRIDFVIAPGIAVEVDGFAHHWSPEAKTRDEARRNQLRLEGLFLLVYTWRDIRYDGRRVATEIVTALMKHAA